MDDLYSEIDRIAGLVDAIPQSDAYQRQQGEDIRAVGNAADQRVYLDQRPTYNYADAQQAAQQINALGANLVQGSKVYDTGNEAINAQLYGRDISNNISAQGSGFRTPRQYDVGAGDYIKAGLEGVIQAYVGAALGSGIANAGSWLGNAVAPPINPSALSMAQGAGELGSAANTANTINNTRTIVGGIFGGDYDFDNVINPRDITASGGSYDMAVLDRPAAPEQPVQNETGGGGGGGSPADRTTGGGQQPPAGQIPSTDPTTGEPVGSVEDAREDEDTWIWNGEVLQNTVTGETREIPNPARMEEGVIYNGDADPLEGQDALEDLTVDAGMNDVAYDPNAVYGWEDPNIDPRTGEPYVDYTAEQDLGGLTSGGVGTGAGTGTGTGSGTGTGTGTGSGNGDGDGDGDGDGSGDGTQVGTPAAANAIAGAAGQGDLFPYSQIAPSQAAQLTGMMDYVAALSGGRR